MSKFYIALSSLFFLTMCSCSSKGDLANFDRKQLRQYYKIDLAYTVAKYKERFDVNYDNVLTDNLPLLLLLGKSNEFTFGRERIVFRSKDLSNLQNFSSDFFEFKIENDSIIYIRDENYLGEDVKDENYLDITTKNDFEQSAILLEYDDDYEYFIFRVIRGVYKDLEFKVVSHN